MNLNEAVKRASQLGITYGQLVQAEDPRQEKKEPEHTSTQATKTMMKRRPKRKDEEKIRKMLNDGLRAGEIAAELGIGRNALYKRLNRIGLSAKGDQME